MFDSVSLCRMQGASAQLQPIACETRSTPNCRSKRETQYEYTRHIIWLPERCSYQTMCQLSLKFCETYSCAYAFQPTSWSAKVVLIIQAVEIINELCDIIVSYPAISQYDQSVPPPTLCVSVENRMFRGYNQPERISISLYQIHTRICVNFDFNYNWELTRNFGWVVTARRLGGVLGKQTHMFPQYADTHHTRTRATAKAKAQTPSNDQVGTVHDRTHVHLRDVLLLAFHNVATTSWAFVSVRFNAGRVANTKVHAIMLIWYMESERVKTWINSRMDFTTKSRTISNRMYM